MKKHTYVPLLLWGAVLAGCSVNSYNPAAVREAVVDGCLVKGRPIAKIRLTNLIPYGGDLDSFSPIADDSLTLSAGDSTWPLVYSGDSGFYQSPDSQRTVQEGDTYTLRGMYNGKSFWAATAVPPQPQGLLLSDTILYVDSSSGFTRGRFAGPGSGADTAHITLTFDNPDQNYYYLLIESVESNPVPIQSDTVRFPGRRFLSAPFTANYYHISPRELKEYGRHKVTLYRVNQEYADLYQNRRQDSRNLTEPKTNVVNGLGIFTAVNCDSVFFEAEPAP